MQRKLWGWSWWVMGLAAIACSEQLSHGDGDGVGGDEADADAGMASVLPQGAGAGGDGGRAAAPEPPVCSGTGGAFGFGGSPRIYGNCTDYEVIVCSGQRIGLSYAGDGPCDEVRLDPIGVPQGGAGGGEAGGEACGDYQVDPDWELGSCLDECCHVAEGTRERRVGTCTIAGECCVMLQETYCGI